MHRLNPAGMAALLQVSRQISLKALAAEMRVGLTFSVSMSAHAHTSAERPAVSLHYLPVSASVLQKRRHQHPLGAESSNRCCKGGLGCAEVGNDQSIDTISNHVIAPHNWNPRKRSCGVFSSTIAMISTLLSRRADRGDFSKIGNPTQGNPRNAKLACRLEYIQTINLSLTEKSEGMGQIL